LFDYLNQTNNIIIINSDYYLCRIGVHIYMEIELQQSNDASNIDIGIQEIYNIDIKKQISVCVLCNRNVYRSVKGI